MVGARKDKADAWMPPRVYKGKSAFEWHPKGGGCVRLCSLETSRAQVWLAYELALEKRNAKPRVTVGDLAAKYFASAGFCRRRPRTQADYQDCWRVLEKVFADHDALKIQPKHVRQYMDRRGASSEVRANREKAVLQNIFSWAFERGIVTLNPVIGVKSFPESAREKYIEDSEYEQFLALSSPLIQTFMELAYLTGARGQDVRKIMLSDLQDQGIYIRQQKTGKKQIKAWTPRLRAVVDTALARRELVQKSRSVISMYLIVSGTGQPYTESGLKSMWAKNKARIETEHKVKIDWTFHDIKAKAISDFDGDKQTFSGHKSRAQMESYNRKPEVVATLNPVKKPAK